MNNHIICIDVTNHSVSPASAELRITVTPERMTPSLEVCGKLLGPRCPYSTTIELAYPLRPLKRSGDALEARVVIPEASLWDAESPFLYAGNVELWENNQRLSTAKVSHGLCHVALNDRGLFVNGKRTRIRAARASGLTNEIVQQLRLGECNAVIVDVRDSTPELCELSDERGLYVLGSVAGDFDLDKVTAREARVSWLGWITDDSNMLTELAKRGQSLVGWRVTDPSSAPPPPQARFLVGSSERLSAFAELQLPRLLTDDALSQAATDEGEILGVVQS